MRESFVGRERELKRLVDALKAAASSHGSFVIITGEPGIGKSRLMSELARIAAGIGQLVLRSQVPEDPTVPPYLPWTLVLREFLRAYDTESLRQDMGQGATDIADIVPELRGILDLNPSDATAEAGGETARYQLFDSVTRFLTAASRRSPLLLLFDDLHLADRSSLALLEYYAHAMQGMRCVIVAAARQPGAHDNPHLRRMLVRLAHNGSCQQIVLLGLARDAVAELLHRFTGRPPAPAVVDRVHAQSDGNPLFICEVGSMLAARRQHGRDPDRLHFIRVPDTLRELIEERLAQIPLRCQRMLTTAAILGREFDVSTLAAIAGTGPASLLAGLEHAANCDIIEQVSPARFRFRHALFREVLYAQHGALRRATLHRRAAEYIEQLAAEDRLAHLSRLAFHYFEAAQLDLTARALCCCIDAGDEAFRRRAYAEAATQFDRALQILELAEQADPAQRFELLMRLGDAQYRSGQLDTGSDTFLKAVLLANHHCWKRRLADALLAFQGVRADLGIGHVAAVPLHLEALKQLADTEGPMRARILGSLSVAQKLAGDRLEAQQSARESIALSRSCSHGAELAKCLTAADWALCGDPVTAPERLALAREAHALATTDGSAQSRLETLKIIVLTLCDVGRIGEAREHLERLWALAQAERHPHYLNVAVGTQAALAIMAGRWNEALKYAALGRSQVSQQGVVGLEGRYGFQMFAIHQARGLLRELSPAIDKAMRIAMAGRPWLPGQLLMYSELGERERAFAVLEQIGDIRRIARDDLYVTVLIYLAQACNWLGDADHCATVYDLLLPLRETNACLPATLIHGAASGYLAQLAVTLRRRHAARLHFEHAIAMNEAMGAHVPLARSQVNFAELLAGGESVEDHQRAQGLLSQAKKFALDLELAPILQRIARLERDSPARGMLTDRELEVLQLIARGASNRRIADTLHVSTSTVATHVRSILRKTGVSNRTEAAAWARSHRLAAAD